MWGRKTSSSLRGGVCGVSLLKRETRQTAFIIFVYLPFRDIHESSPPWCGQDTFTRFLGHALAAAAEPGRVLLQKEASVTALLAPGIGSRGRKRGSLGDTGGAGFGVGGEGDLTWPYLTRAAEILTTFSKSDSVVKEGVAEDQCLTGKCGRFILQFPLCRFQFTPKYVSYSTLESTLETEIEPVPSGGAGKVVQRFAVENNFLLREPFPRQSRWNTLKRRSAGVVSARLCCFSVYGKE